VCVPGWISDSGCSTVGLRYKSVTKAKKAPAPASGNRSENPFALDNCPEKIDRLFAQVYSSRRFSIDFSVSALFQGAHQGRQSSPITLPQRVLSSIKENRFLAH